MFSPQLTPLFEVGRGGKGRVSGELQARLWFTAYWFLLLVP